MSSLAKGYERDSCFIAAHYQPAVLLDLGLSRGIDSHLLLRGTQLFFDDMMTGQARISPAQFLTIIGNCRRLLGADDTSFLYGQRMLPGHYGETSQVLHQARDLRQALAHLCLHYALLSPLLTPRFFENETHVFIYWLDSCGAGTQQRFLVEASMTAVVSMARWLSGKRTPWKFYFTHAQPAYIEQYWVHLNEDITFDQQLNMMSLPREYLDQPWPNAASIGGSVALLGSRIQLNALGSQASFLDLLYNHLRSHIRQPLNLENVAQAFAMSPSSLKRKLQKHDTHFQEQLDLARKHVALYLYQFKGYTNNEVANYLRFNDITNFRRSFKRWTGLLPSDLRQLLKYF